MNKIILCGRLTRDPDLRTNGDNNIARYSLAVDRRFKREGEPDADFFNCTVFGKGADFAEKYLRQGTKVLITGRLQSDNYTNKDGQKVYGWQVIVEEQEFAESKKAQEQHSELREPKNEENLPFVDIADGIVEDLPFI